MNQFFFGSANRPLYGVHHEAASSEYRQSGVLVCYPFGREYMRCHRALVRLCDRLAGSGYHCLRFDYFGTGDSAGDSGEGDMGEWLANARSAAQELRDVSGLDRLTIVGVRLGAAVALGVASNDPLIDRIVLWDPVVSGSRYLDELESVHARFVIDTDRFPKKGTTVRNDNADELVGMICPPSMRQSIRGVDLERMTGIHARVVSIIATDDREEFRKLVTLLEKYVPDCRYKVVNDQIAWDNLAELGAVLIPHELLQAIHQTLVAERE